jgi:hypothetical protein
MAKNGYTNALRCYVYMYIVLCQYTNRWYIYVNFVLSGWLSRTETVVTLTTYVWRSLQEHRPIYDVSILESAAYLDRSCPRPWRCHLTDRAIPRLGGAVNTLYKYGSLLRLHTQQHLAGKRDKCIAFEILKYFHRCYMLGVEPNGLRTRIHVSAFQYHGQWICHVAGGKLRNEVLPCFFLNC